MSKSNGHYILTFMALLLAGVVETVCGQSGIFDRAGIIPDHGTYSSLPEETVDLFTGNLILSYRDIFLPGANGLNIEVWRVYNSKVLYDKPSGQQNPTVQAYPKSMVGLGWTMHMGMVHNAYSSTPVIEFPDGRREIAFPPKSEYGWGPAYRVTRDFLKYYCQTGNDPKLYFQNGVVWTFGNIASLPLAGGSSEIVYMVTRIEDPLGNFIDIEYDAQDSLRSISQITDSMGREVRFVKTYQGSDPAKLAEIRIRDFDDTHDVIYSYSVGSFPNSGYYKLTSFMPPELLTPTTYEYNDGSANNYELTRVTTSYGGALEYSYENHSFYFNATELISTVVSQKQITFNPGEQPEVWDYTYPTYQGASSGTTTVDGPEYEVSAAHYGYESNSANRWRIGLETASATGDGSASAAITWTNHEISDTNWMVLGVNMGKAKGPLISVSTESRTGDSTLATNCYYLRSDVKRYGLPTKLSRFVNGAPSAKSNKELTYFFEAHSAFKDRYMLAFVETDEDKTAAGDLLHKTVSSYFEEDGKWGALKQIKRNKNSLEYLTWDYTYHTIGTNYQTITTDGPGASGISNVTYHYGLEDTANAPDFLKYSRWITKYSYLYYEWNQFEAAKGYVYDALGRITAVNYYHDWIKEGDPQPPPPDPYLTVNYSWRPDGENKVVITRPDDNTIIRHWDGMGRDRGYTESGAGTTLYYLKQLDAEGRVKRIYKGSTAFDEDWVDYVYSYLYDDSGRVIQVTDPVAEVATIQYSANHTKTVTDPEGHSTVFAYNDLPGLPTQVTDAQSHTANYMYDAVGRLTTVSYLGRQQSYGYDWLDHVTSESHPETGLIQYQYNSANRLETKTWGGTLQGYAYNASGQTVHTWGAENIFYDYDEKGALVSVGPNAGWSRTGITHNDFGQVTAETVTISGLGSKSLSYAYDNYGNLLETTYPDGNKATMTIIGLDRPDTLAFGTASQDQLVNSASYGPNKSLAAAGYLNGTSWSSTFFDNGAPHVVTLMKDSTALYNATYDYDGAGNITSISSTAPAPALNSSFGYDSLNRLTSATYTTGAVGTYSFEYDAYGNMLSVRHDGIPAFSKAYKASNQIDDPSYQYDSRGNLTAAPGRIYQWDSQNRLQTVRDAAGQYVAGYRYDDRSLRIASYPPLPDIDVYNYPTGFYADITASLQSPEYKTFILRNLGQTPLNIIDIGPEKKAGTDWEMFSVTQAPTTPVPLGQSTEFTIQFLPTSTGNKAAKLLIASNDPDENPYVINLRGFCEPEIEIGQCGNGGTYDFGTENVGEFISYGFNLDNYGTATLVLYEGWPIEIDEPGGEQNFYLEDHSGGNEVLPSGHNTFTIRFVPMSEGPKTATITIWNNDLDENPYTIYLTGTGLWGPEKIIEDETELALLSPNGGECLEASTIREIRWKGCKRAEAVTLEYSTDNGSSYRTIVERAANVGSYPWFVPQDLSGSCLVRISDPDGSPTMPAIFSFEFNFRVLAAEGESLPDPHFVFRAGVPDLRTQSFQVAEVALAPDGLRGSENLLFNYALGEVQELDRFLGTWHHARITYDMTNYTGAVWIDSRPILNTVPLKADLDVRAAPEVSLSHGPEVTLWVDDLDVRFIDLSRTGQYLERVVFRPLFRDNFGRYATSLLPREGGWLPGLEKVQGGEKMRQGETGREGVQMQQAARTEERSGVDDLAFASSAKSFKLAGSEEEPGTFTKRFSLPSSVPFSVSAEAFSIVEPGGEVQTEPAGRAVSEKEKGKDEKREQRGDGSPAGIRRGRGVDRRLPEGMNSRARSLRPSGSKSGDVKMLSGALPNGTYYIYSFDGRLLAEYDVSGLWIRDYIYFGGQLVAEYRATETGSRYFYYASDQISSTRIVTDSTGTVVYSAAHEPYGGIQKTWVGSYDPELKFSGKPRDSESGLDYFGARYYDRSQYRFVSTDPILSSLEMITSPAAFNGYCYCKNCPTSYYDPDGEQAILVQVKREKVTPISIDGSLLVNGEYLGPTWELPWKDNEKKESCIKPGYYPLNFEYMQKAGAYRPRIPDLFIYPRTAIFMHRSNGIYDLEGCVGGWESIERMVGGLDRYVSTVQGLLRSFGIMVTYGKIGQCLDMWLWIYFQDQYREIDCPDNGTIPAGKVSYSWYAYFQIDD